MFCKSCGNKIDDDSSFCSYCGTRQSNTNKPLLEKNETNTQIDPKTINVNLSFGRPNSSKNSHQSYSNNSITIDSKYDSTYKKETEATVIGSIILIASLALTIFKPFEFNTNDAYNNFKTGISIGAILLRILSTAWVVSIAKNQNRENFSWGIFAFFLPSIALILIGLQKKLFMKIDIDNSLSDEDNSLILTEKAQDLFNNKKHSESIRFLEKAIELDKKNTTANELLLKIKLQIPVSEISDKHSQIVYRETRDKKILKIISKNYQTIGANVYINDEIAPDGEYHYLNDNRILTVKNGKISQMKN